MPAAARGQRHAKSEAGTVPNPTKFFKEEFDAFLERGILAQGFLSDEPACSEGMHEETRHLWG